jgi:hypothetical protein
VARPTPAPAHRGLTDRAGGRYFLKEISSDGDLSTVDVIFPAAPMLLALRPELLVRQIVPLLACVPPSYVSLPPPLSHMGRCSYGNNETTVAYPKPFAPHHLGYYPVGDILPSQQEDMPVEETANLLLMLAAAVRAECVPLSCPVCVCANAVWSARRRCLCSTRTTPRCCGRGPSTSSPCCPTRARSCVPTTLRACVRSGGGGWRFSD